MAIQYIDASAATGSHTYSLGSVDADGVIITGPAACSAIYVRTADAGAFSVGGGGAAEVPLDADTWTLVWQQSPGLACRAEVYVEPSAGTTTVYARVV